MTITTDYYQVLGVLRDAEQVVITAAYRALTSVYHPDRWRGNPEEATRRMMQINLAYDSLHDPIKRADYDRSHKIRTGSMGDDAESVDNALDSAMLELEERWQIAVEVLPDLQTTRQRLSKTAYRLAFAFVVSMLENKRFQHRDQIANELEAAFLESHFGVNSEVLRFAKWLINLGKREPIRALNRYVDVLGSDLDSSLIINKVIDEYELRFFIVRPGREKEVSKMRRTFLDNKRLPNAIELIEEYKLTVKDIGGGLFSNAMPQYSVYTWSVSREVKSETLLDNVPVDQLIDWVSTNLC